MRTFFVRYTEAKLKNSLFLLSSTLSVQDLSHHNLPWTLAGSSTFAQHCLREAKHSQFVKPQGLFNSSRSARNKSERSALIRIYYLLGEVLLMSLRALGWKSSNETLSKTPLPHCPWANTKPYSESSCGYVDVKLVEEVQWPKCFLSSFLSRNINNIADSSISSNNFDIYMKTPIQPHTIMLHFKILLLTVSYRNHFRC